MKIYSGLYKDFHPFDLFYPEAECIVASNPEDLTDKDGWLVIHGGSDIHPSFYNRVKDGTYCDLEPSKQDLQEWALIQRAIELGLPILGICRGAQMGCAAAGGILIQDVNGHHGNHFIRTIENHQIISNSIHHQMMFPWKVNHELIAWAEPYKSGLNKKSYRGLNDDEFEYLMGVADEKREPEIVWFPDIKCLAIQGHPEMLSEKVALNKYLHHLMEKYYV